MIRGVRAAPDDDELHFLSGRATITLARSVADRGREKEALALLRDARESARGAHADEIRVLSAVQMAGLLGRSGRWVEATRILGAIDLDGPGVTSRAANVIRLNLGMAHQYLGHPAESQQHLTAARAGSAADGHPDLEFMAMHNLGRLAFVEGRIPQSLALMAEADALPAEVERVTSRYDRSRVLLEAGLLDEAGVMLARAEEEARANRLVRDIAEITLERARMLLLVGQYPQARAAAIGSARLFASQRAVAWQTRSQVLRIEADLAAGHRLRAAARDAAALAEGRAARAQVGLEASLLAAEAEARSGQVAAARARLAGVGTSRGLSFTNRLHLALTRASVARAAGDLRSARRSLSGAAACLADEQARYAGLDNRTALALHGRRLAAIDLDLALQSGSPRAVYTATERWRGISNRLDPVSPSGDTVLDGLLAELRQARLELRTAEGEGRDALVADIARLERAAAHRDWETASAERGPGPASTRHTARRPVPYPDLRARLTASGTGLVGLFVHDGRFRAVTIEADRSSVVDLADEDEVVELVRRATADLTTMGRVTVPALRDAVDRSLTSAMARLDGLLAPAYPRSAERVVVLPSRLLASLPWRLLPRLAGRPLVVTPSATFWATDRAGSSTGGPAAVVALAGPELARAGAEVSAVAAAWGPPASALVAATGSDLTTALRDARIVHVAAHGTHHDQSPLFSHVLLADGPVFAHEFQRVGVGAEHVVLSACDVGRAHVRHGEEALGLTSSLLAGGVHNVLASAAPVRDEEAEAVMRAYHRELTRGTDVALALERAAAGIPDGRLFCSYGADWATAPSLR